MLNPDEVRERARRMANMRTMVEKQMARDAVENRYAVNFSS